MANTGAWRWKHTHISCTGQSIAMETARLSTAFRSTEVRFMAGHGLAMSIVGVLVNDHHLDYGC